MVDRVGDIIAFSSLCNTTVYAYCNCYSDQGWRWLPYKLLTGHQTNYPCVYLVNKHGHFEPVLDVQDDLYSRTPYFKISDSLNCRYHHYVSQEVFGFVLSQFGLWRTKVEGLRGYQSSTYIYLQQKIHG